MTKKYNVIYADPPWSYKQKSAGRGNKSGAVDKYDTMDVIDISNMGVKELSEENALCFMWATTPILPDAFKLIKDWRFTYKTMITWEKTSCLGMGNWLRTQTEFILIGVKGKVKPFNHQEKNIFKHPICHHSAKPHFFRKKVEELASKSFPECRKVELFARSREGMFSDYEFEGWDVYGNQVNNSIIIHKKSIKISDLKEKHPRIYEQAIKYQMADGVLSEPDETLSIPESFWLSETKEGGTVWISVSRGDFKPFYDFYSKTQLF